MQRETQHMMETVQSFRVLQFFICGPTPSPAVFALYVRLVLTFSASKCLQTLIFIALLWFSRYTENCVYFECILVG
jgi:hypothetical protein